MQWFFISSFIVIVCCLQQYCLAQTTTVRPYKFGFTIEEQQHRYEKRDERGIVMGEFGFITADGIYHVTVYATDEQGRFRILAMKNYPYESPPKSVEVLVKPKIPITTTTTTTTQKPVLTRHNFHTEACSGCFLKNGNTKPKSLNDDGNKNFKIDIRTLAQELPDSANLKPKVPSVQQGSVQGTQSKGPIAGQQPQQRSPGFKSSSNTPTGNTSPIMDIILEKVLPTLMAKKDTQPTTTTNAVKTNAPSSKVAGSINKFIPGAGNPLKNSAFDTTNRNTNSNPSRVNGDGDLYRFKYILDYHGHTETGKRNGNKEGNYFAIGDDNVERTIEYVANENGYQPRIRWRKLTQNEIKPKENSLKDYEFVWFTQ